MTASTTLPPQTPTSEPRRATTPSPAGPPRRTSRRTGGGWLYLAPAVVYLLVFYAYPLARNIDLSLRDYTVRSFVTGDAPFIGLGNFREVLSDPTFSHAALNTAIFTVASIAAQYVLGLALAVFFHQSFRLSGVLRALFLVPWLLPLIVSASTWSWMLNSDSGMVNAVLESVGLPGVNWLTSPSWSLTAVTLANIWIGIPFNLVILYSGLQSIPEDVYEAASLDGAGRWATFRHITLPLLRPVTAITLLLGLIYTLKVFDIIWIMTRGGPGDSSITMTTWSYQEGFGSMLPHFGPAAAIGNLLIVVAMAFGALHLVMTRRTALQ